MHELEAQERAAELSRPLRPLINSISAAGGSAFLVGGWVRDILLGRPAKDWDLEVFGLSAGTLKRILGASGAINLVGQSFAVFKYRPADSDIELDVALPRRDQKVGAGHRGFNVTYDPEMSLDEASRRRDLTVNAIFYDPAASRFIDPHGGLADLDHRLLRAVDHATFVEDSLRVLRVAQLAARLNFDVAPATLELCRTVDLGDLPAERVREEIFKIYLQAQEPSRGFELLNEMGALKQLFPEISALVGVEQDPIHHPEGDVFVHTLMAIDEAAALTGSLRPEERLTVMLAVTAHDFGKAAATERSVETRGSETIVRIRSIGHENAGVEPATSFLDRLGIHTISGYQVREQVIGLVLEHLKPPQLYRAHQKGAEPSRRTFARIAERCDPRLLAIVSTADIFARPPLAKDPSPIEYFNSRISQLGLQDGLPEPILKGRHLIEAGLAAPGPSLGRILKAVYEKQLEGGVESLEQALALARELIEHA